MSTKFALYLVGLVQLVLNAWIFSHMLPVHGWLITIIAWIAAGLLAALYMGLFLSQLAISLSNNTREITDEEWDQSKS